MIKIIIMLTEYGYCSYHHSCYLFHVGLLLLAQWHSKLVSTRSDIKSDRIPRVVP